MKRKVIKKLKSGTMQRDDLEYLKTLSASEIYMLCDNPDNAELLKYWNELQHTPNKRRNFTFVDKRYPKRINIYLKGVYPEGSSVKWAYIRHDKDGDGVEHVHYHYYLEFPNPRSFASVANDLKIPVNNLQAVIDKKGILQYLTHENAPDKHHYDKDEIVSNFNISNEVEKGIVDLHQEFEDWKAVRQGAMSFHDFIDKYQSTLYDITMSNRIRIYDRALGYK